ncbi:hypothetical protein E2F46_09945 [Luteimonas aestuarii]|uniref:Uncharacterized protein n=1 Tax=Luteimonas aestuarii TaxID=453837 RepID=A0A4R5TNA0_9GAMM|nr:hypothetical protein [Luteimonas aestuarii]TDK23841.1 hypothetical protein E2F46_09945 [Luteimonas aestuarii]
MLRTGVLIWLAWLLCSAAPADAQAIESCPRLPDGSGLRWEQRDVPGMVFCKALSTADATEMFTVTLGGSLPFRPVGSQQVGRGTVGGQRVRWYRGSDGFDPTVQVRETLLRLGRGRDVHVVVRAPSEDVLETRMQLVEGLAFDP